MEFTTSTLTISRCLDLLEDILEKKLCREFLLNTASTSDLTILTSKIHTHHALVGQIKVDFSEANSFHNLFTTNWLIFPGFSVEHYSAILFSKEQVRNTDRTGRKVLESTNNATSTWRGPGTNFSRAIRDEKEGVVVAIDLDSNYHFAEVMVMMASRTSRTRQRGNTRIEKDLQARNFKAIRASVHMMLYTTENQTCNMCLPGNIRSCNPSTPIVPSNALDLSAFMNNSALSVGAYAGYMSERDSLTGSNTSRDIPIFAASYGGNEPSTFGRLHSCAIYNALSKYFAQSAPQKTPFSATLVADAHRTIAAYLPSENAESSSFPVNVHMPNRHNFRPNSVQYQQSSNQNIHLHIPAPEITYTVDIRAPSFSNPSPVLNQNENVRASLMIPSHIRPSPDERQARPQTSAVPPGSGEKIPWSRTPTASNTGTQISVPEGHVPFPSRATIGRAENSSTPNRVVTIAPHPQLVSRTQAENDEIEARKERRKIRKRESAARSYQRKLAKNNPDSSQNET